MCYTHMLYRRGGSWLSVLMLIKLDTVTADKPVILSHIISYIYIIYSNRQQYTALGLCLNISCIIFIWVSFVAFLQPWSGLLNLCLCQKRNICREITM